MALSEEDDRRHMARALELAARGVGRTSPNPAVGAVIVKRGKVIGEGWHKKAGGAHAEVAAIRSCAVSPRGATIYVTLEPCNHTGRTGPCATAIREAGIVRVVVGARDLSPKNGARGCDALSSGGIAVVTGVMADEARRLVADFHKFAATGLPWVILKCAVTLDGKIATRTGDSQWVTGPAARKRVHRMRNQVDAVMIGVETALADDPALTVRHGTGRTNPLRIVVDSKLRIAEKSQLIRTAREIPTLVVTTAAASDAKIERLRKKGVTALVTPGKGGRVSLPRLMKTLGRRNIMRILVEGADTLAGGLMDEGLIDEVAFFIAPKIVGGPRSAVGGGGVATMADAHTLADERIELIGNDILVTGLIRRP